MRKIGVIGAGSWGTALAVNLARNNHEVVIWSIMEDEIKMLNEHREHIDKLPGVKLAENIYFIGDVYADEPFGYGVIYVANENKKIINKYFCKLFHNATPFNKFRQSYYKDCIIWMPIFFIGSSKQVRNKKFIF